MGYCHRMVGDAIRRRQRHLSPMWFNSPKRPVHSEYSMPTPSITDVIQLPKRPVHFAHSIRRHQRHLLSMGFNSPKLPVHSAHSIRRHQRHLLPMWFNLFDQAPPTPSTANANQLQWINQIGLAFFFSLFFSFFFLFFFFSFLFFSFFCFLFWDKQVKKLGIVTGRPYRQSIAVAVSLAQQASSGVSPRDDDDSLDSADPRHHSAFHQALGRAAAAAAGVVNPLEELGLYFGSKRLLPDLPPLPDSALPAPIDLSQGYERMLRGDAATPHSVAESGVVDKSELIAEKTAW